MAELDEISRVQSHFSPHFLLIFLIYLARALAILYKLGRWEDASSRRAFSIFSRVVFRTALWLTEQENDSAWIMGDSVILVSVFFVRYS